MDPTGLIGGLIGAGASIFGSEQSAQAVEQTNAANIANQQLLNAENWQHTMYLDTHHIRDVVGDARRAGINPLAALGVNTPSAPVAVGSTLQAPDRGAGMRQAGQDISAALQQYASETGRHASLQNQLLEAQIDQTRADTATQMLKNSQVARTFASPGYVPLPRPDPRRVDTLPLYQDYRDRAGGRVTLLSKDASEALMNASSLPIAPVIGAGLVGSNIPNAIEALRPDVSRSLNLPDWSAAAGAEGRVF